MIELWLVFAGFAAGVINVIAGGGPLLTLAALTAAGLDPRIANLSSTVALCPGQLLAGWWSRHSLGALSEHGLPPSHMLLVSLSCGALGAALLLATGSAQFGAVVPWLILFATALYAWSGRGGRMLCLRRMGRIAFLGCLASSSLYGGYFGGGNSFVVLALLAIAGLAPLPAAAAKNLVIASINAGAVTVFVMSGEVDWHAAAAVGLGGIAGSLTGVTLLAHIKPGALRTFVIICGLTLAGWFFAT